MRQVGPRLAVAAAIFAVGVVVSVLVWFSFEADAKKEAPTVVVTVRGVTMVSTGVVTIQLPEGADKPGEIIKADVGSSVTTAGVLSSPWAQIGIYIALGAVLVFLFQLVKARLGLSGNFALAAISTVSSASGVGVSALFGGLDLLNASLGAAVVVASTQLVYKLFVRK